MLVLTAVAVTDQLDTVTFYLKAVHGSELGTNCRGIQMTGQIDHGATTQATRVVVRIGPTIVAGRAIAVCQFRGEAAADERFE